MHTITTPHLAAICGGHIRYEAVLSLTNGSTFNDNGWYDMFYSQDTFMIDGVSHPEVFSSGLMIDGANIFALPIENGVAYHLIVADY